MRPFISLLVFSIALQFSSYLLWAFNVCPKMVYPFGNIDTIGSVFGLTVFTLAFTAVGVAGISVISAVLRIGSYMYLALVLWVLGCLLAPGGVAGFFLAIPNTIGGLLPAETNPLPPINGVPQINPIVIVITGIFAFVAFWFFIEIALQRNVQ